MKIMKNDVLIYCKKVTRINQFNVQKMKSSHNFNNFYSSENALLAHRKADSRSELWKSVIFILREIFLREKFLFRANKPSENKSLCIKFESLP